jgi:O-antigen ligase
MFMMSISQFLLAASFFFEGNFIEKFKRFFRNKPALIITGIFLLHVIGMLWTTNYIEGWRDIRVKLPLFTLTVMLSGSEPLTKKQFHLILGFFIIAVFAGTMVSMAVLDGIIHRPVNDIRDIFIFHISHIRFALFTCVAIFSLLYFLQQRNSVLIKTGITALILWLFLFLFIMESITGISISLAIIILLILYRAFTSSRVLLKISLILIAVIIPSIFFLAIKKISKQYHTTKNILIDVNEKTQNGNSYTFDFSSINRENGYQVWVYISEVELRKEWNDRSNYKYDSLDKRNQNVKYTLIRFLASKGWKKDGEAVRNLTVDEIRAIEKGIANVNYEDVSSIRARVLQIVWEYDQFIHGGGANGHSVIQRFEFWKAASGIIKEHPLFGVGTGDMPQAYQFQYIKINSTLDAGYRLRAHNQYLAITVAFGFIGLFYFLFALIAPMIITKRYFDYFYLIFFLIAMLSMITEDTLETQAGATFFAFFNAFFLFERKNEPLLIS